MSNAQVTRNYFAESTAVLANVHAITIGVYEALKQTPHLRHSINGKHLDHAFLSQLVQQRIMRKLRASGA